MEQVPLLDHSRTLDLYGKYPLDTRRTEIRLLKLQAGAWHDRLVCDFEVISLDDEHKPAYSALSYVWGRTQAENLVTIDGYEIPIRPSLFTALRRLRAHYIEFLWADALCIDQGSNDERSVQVGIMGSIYARAHEVCIWMGEMDFADQLWGDLRVDYDPGRSYRTSPQSPESHDPGVIPEHEMMLQIANFIWIVNSGDNAFKFFRNWGYGWSNHQIQHFNLIINAFSNHKWFNRLWTVQELILASNATVYCSSVALSLEHIYQATAEYDAFMEWDDDPTTRRKHNRFYQKLFDVGFVRFVEMANMKQSLQSDSDDEKTISIVQLRLHLQKRFASVDLDQVYSLFGLLDGAQIRGQLPLADYNLAAPIVYTDISRRHIRAFASLLPLSIAGMKNRYPNTPSWAIDWTILQSETVGFDSAAWTELELRFQAFSGLQTKEVDIDGDAMYLSGVYVDEITETIVAGSDRFFQRDFSSLRMNQETDNSNLDEKRISFKHLAMNRKMDETYPGTRLDWKDAWFRTLRCDCLYDRSPGNPGTLRRTTNSESNLISSLYHYGGIALSFPKPGPRFYGGSPMKIYMGPLKHLTWVKKAPDDKKSKLEPFDPTQLTWNLEKSVAEQILKISTGRTLFLTKRGYLGIANNCQVGNKVFIVANGRRPLILQQQEEVDTYRNVADCYLHGFMDGKHNKRLLKEQGGLKTLKIV